MIQRKRSLILVGALTALAALTALFPARVAYWLATPPHVAMSGFSGTVWNGSAREFSTNGIYLRDVEWKMHPLSLLTGDVSFSVSGSPVSGFFDSQMAVSLDGSVTLRDLSAALPVAMLEPAIGIPGLRGSASLKFDRLELVGGRATAMNGSIDISGLSVPMLAGSPLGDYRAEFSTQNNGIIASVEDTSGVIDLAGTLQINPDKTYSFRGLVMATQKTPESLRNRLQYLGKTNRPDQYELSLDGSY